MENSRRQFLKSLGLGSVATLTGQLSFSGLAPAQGEPQNRLEALPTNAIEGNYKTISNWDFFSSRLIGDKIIVHAINIENLNKVVSYPGNNDLVVYADTLIIKGKLTMPGRKVFLHAREIKCQENACIDVSGADNTEILNPRIDGADSSETGKHGHDGETGKNGQAGGQVQIFVGHIEGVLKVLAEGGKGGNGNPGGNGQRGAKGSEGADAPRNKPGNAQPGGDGARGGNAGRGGKGGKGGDGGIINIHAVENVASFQLSSTFGFGGEPGANGVAGEGGEGGPGGRVGTFKTSGGGGGGRNGGERPEVWVLSDQRASNGKNGLNGDNALPQVKGDNGNSRQEGDFIIASQYADLAKHASYAQLQMNLHYAELQFLQEQYSEAGPRLLWLGRLSAPQQLGDTTSQPGETGPDEWQAFQNKVGTLILRLRLGLNAYGKPRNYIPLLSFAYYEAVVPKIEKAATAIERDLVAFRNAKKDNDNVSAQLSSSIEQAREAANATDKQVLAAVQAIESLQNRIAVLSEEILKQDKELRTSYETFRRAVEMQYDNCSLGQLLKFVSAVIAVPTTTYGGILAAIQEGKGDVVLSNKIDAVIHISDAVSGGVESLKKAFGSLPSTNLGLDGPKLVVEGRDYEQAVSKFDAAMEKYQDLPEGEAYSNLVHRFIDTCKARNQAQLLLAALITTKDNLKAEATQFREEAKRVAFLLEQKNDIGLVEYVVFMESLYQRVKANLIRLLEEARTALNFVTFSSTPGQYMGYSVSALMDNYTGLITDLKRELQSQAGIPSSDKVPISLERAILPDAFKTLESQGQLVFTIRADDDALRSTPLTSIRAKEVSIEMFPAPSSERPRLVLIHGVESTFLDPRNSTYDKRNYITFTHDSRASLVVIGKEMNNLGGDEKTFAYLSPATVWTIIAKPEWIGLTPTQMRTFLSKVEKIVITFNVFGQTINKF